ncbi:MAG: hypothetical protein D6812_00260 [Deltaproteobacteria bacterium]|nr:MAG: hypothetical protein D6812_00260 [Deltaproteobacteria bacterium]
MLPDHSRSCPGHVDVGRRVIPLCFENLPKQSRGVGHGDMAREVEVEAGYSEGRCILLALLQALRGVADIQSHVSVGLPPTFKGLSEVDPPRRGSGGEAVVRKD